MRRKLFVVRYDHWQRNIRIYRTARTLAGIMVAGAALWLLGAMMMGVR